MRFDSSGEVVACRYDSVGKLGVGFLSVNQGVQLGLEPLLDLLTVLVRLRGKWFVSNRVSNPRSAYLLDGGNGSIPGRKSRR